MSSENFYQRRNNPAIRRRTRPVIIDAAKQPVRPPSGSDAKPSDVARKSLKRFAIVVASMMVLLVVSVKLLEHVWSRRDRQLARETAVLESTTSEPNAVLSPATPVPTPVPAISRVELETPVVELPAGADDAERAGPTELFRWGKILEQAGELNGAAMLYEQSIDADPENAEVLSQAGRLFIRLSQHARAVPLLQQAHTLVPDDADVMNDLGVALTFNGEASQAVLLYEKLFAQHPDYVPALFNQGYAEVQLRAWSKARPLLEAYLARQASNAMAIGVLATVELAETNTTRALELLDQAILVAPSWITPYLDAAGICAAKGEPQRAVDYLERALDVGDPAAVFQHYSSPVFREIRNSEAGMELEKKIAARARQTLGAAVAPAP